MNPNLPKAILLDMDDTIISYDHGVDTDSCWREACRHLSDELDIEDVVVSIKESARWHWSDPERHRIGRLDLRKARAEIISVALQSFNMDDLSISDQIAYVYGELRDKAVKPFDGAIETIQKLKAHGIKLALLTNGNAETQWIKIRKFGLPSLFNTILVEGEFGIGKPDDRIYLHALKELGVTADEAWMIGDNYEWEIVAPQRLGIKGIWLDHKGVGVPAASGSQPYRIIKSLTEIWDDIEEVK
jgi:putative hydrolase of the HAD superfamily